MWRANLDQPQARIDRLLQVLSAEERERAERFHFAADRNRHIIGRGLVRTLLGRCLGFAADQLQFAYNEFGKPTLGARFSSRLKFNVSHSGSLVLVALAHGRELGVDVEFMRSEMSRSEIAARFFSAAECRALMALQPQLRCEAFFACWTRKEAYLKARGDGLSLSLAAFDVAFAPGEEPRLLAARHDAGEVHRWTIRALEPGYGCKAAVAVQGSDWQLECWDWPGTLV